MKIDTNKYVSLSYDLTVGEENEQELMEQATAEQPLQFIFGTNTMLPAFEKNLEDLSEGDSFDFTLTSEEGYGDYDEANIIDLPKNIFEVDGKIDEEMLFEGNTLPMMDSNGNRLMGSVVSVGESDVTMDFNHPLAGETLHFKGNVLSVREASAEEIAQLFSNDGCGGSCGSGCSCGDGDDEMSGGCGGGCGCGC